MLPYHMTVTSHNVTQDNNFLLGNPLRVQFDHKYCYIQYCVRRCAGVLSFTLLYYVIYEFNMLSIRANILSEDVHLGAYNDICIMYRIDIMSHIIYNVTSGLL